MKTVSDASHPPPSIGQNVTVPIPEVDGGKGNLRNIIAVVISTVGLSLIPVSSHS